MAAAALACDDMTLVPPEEDGLSFDLLAASFRHDAADLAAFREAFAAKLEAALPARTSVRRRRRGLLSGGREVESVAVALDEAVYELRFQRGAIRAERQKVVRGIAIRSDELDLEAWLDALSDDLVRLAERSAGDAAALGRLLH